MDGVTSTVGVVEITLKTDGKTSEISVAKLVAAMTTQSNRGNKNPLEVRILPLILLLINKIKICVSKINKNLGY